MTRTRILVVDNDTRMLQAVEAVLAGAHEVVTCARSTEALETARRFRPHIAILDVRMPELDGFALLGLFTEELPDVQVILMTGSVYDLDRELARAVREKAFYFLQKPFDRELLLTLIDRCNEVRKLEEDNKRYVEKLESQIREAEAFQRSILPALSSRIEGVPVAVRHLPCEDLGGDIVDYADAGEGRIAFLVADVVGHGVSAAMLTGILKAAFHDSRTLGYAPEAVVSRAASGMSAFPAEFFVTLIAARLSTREGRLDYVNAGHEGGFVWDSAGVRHLEKTSPMVSSLFTHPVWETRALAWAKDTRLLLFSDGVIEAEREEEAFGIERLEAAVLRSGLSGEKLLDRILAEAISFAGDRRLEDDMTLLTAG